MDNGTRIIGDNLAQIQPLEEQGQTQAKYTRLRLVVKDTLSDHTTRKTGSLISQMNLAIPLLPPILKEGHIPALKGPTTSRDRGPLARDLTGVSLSKVTAMRCLSTQLIKDRTLSSNRHGPPIKLRIPNTQPGTLTKTQLVATLMVKVELLITLNRIPTTHRLESTPGVEFFILGVIRIPIPVSLLFLDMFLMVSISSLDHLGKIAQQLSGHSMI